MIRLACHNVALAASLIAGATSLLHAQQTAPHIVPTTVGRTITTESAGTVAPTTSPTKVTRMPTQITLQREVFDYASSGRRDPYKSLMSTSDIRPLLSDLRLTAVAFDPDGDRSVAILRDSFSKTQYRIRVGQQIGRLRVAAINEKTVQFTVEEFGFNREQTLRLSSDSAKVRNQ